MAGPVIFGEMPDGSQVHAVEIGGDRLHARILTLGARLHGLSLDHGPNVVVAQDMEGYLGSGRFNGPVVGPVANRIAGARVEIAGHSYALEANENGNCLHSGSLGCQDLIWQIESQTEDSVSLHCVLAAGHGGFPGNRELRATYSTAAEGLALELQAKTDAPTLINLAHHAYWTLGGDEALEVFTDRYLPVDAEKIPTGEIAPVACSPYDHREARRPDPTLDHNFCFEPSEDPRLMARVTGASKVLDVFSDAPGLQVYAGGAKGIAIEPQLWPDAPHHPHFPSILLAPGETFRQVTRFRLRELPPSV